MFNKDAKRILILEYLEDYIINRQWDEIMYDFIGKEFDVKETKLDSFYVIEYERHYWSIPTDAAEVIDPSNDIKIKWYTKK
jgi:hypothetical protein